MLYFLDSNIISYVLNGKNNTKEKLEELLLKGNNFSVPAIAYYEVKRGLVCCGATKKLAIFDNFINFYGIVALTQNTFDIATKVYAHLKKSGTLIEDADLLIACSAIENDATLITNNASHLKRVLDLKIKEI